MTKTRDYEAAVRYEREGSIYYDIYYTTSRGHDVFLEYVKKHWHNNNDHLFPEAVDARFFIEVM